MSKIFEGIYLGNWEHARDKNQLDDNCISHIVNCAPAVDNFHPNNFAYKKINILDMDQFDPYHLLDEAVDHIVKSLQEDKATGVFIHGFKESDPRPVGVLLSYIIREKNLNVILAMELIQKKNPEARIEQRWMPFLKRYYNDCCKKSETNNKEKLLAEYHKKKSLIQKPTQKSLKTLLDNLVSLDPKEKTNGFLKQRNKKANGIQDNCDVEEIPEKVSEIQLPEQEQSAFNTIRDSSIDSARKLNTSNFKEITKQRLNDSKAKVEKSKFISSSHLPNSIAFKYDYDREHNCAWQSRKTGLMRSTLNGILQNKNKLLHPLNTTANQNMNKTGIQNIFKHRSQPKLQISLDNKKIYKENSVPNPFIDSNFKGKNLWQPNKNFISEYKEKYPSKFLHHNNSFMIQKRLETEKNNLNFSNDQICDFKNNESSLIKKNNESSFITQPKNQNSLNIRKDIGSYDTPFNVRKSSNQYNIFRVNKLENATKKAGSYLGHFFNEYRVNKSQKNYPQMNEDWSKFCRGNQGIRSNLSCQKCNYIICTQAEIETHAHDWIKKQYYKHVEEPNVTNKSYNDDHNKSHSTIHADCQKARAGDPKDCNGVFLKSSDWVKFNCIDKSGKVACPKCRSIVGLVKLSGLKCGCGHWNMPGFQILKKQVNLNKG